MRVRIPRQGRTLNKNLQNFFNHRARFQAALIMGVLMCCSVLAFATRAYNRRELLDFKVNPETVTAPVFLPSPTRIQNPATDQPMQAEIITIRPHGFEPQKIERPTGRFILNVDNRSGLSAVSLQLDRVGGGRFQAAHVPREKLDWIDSIDLPPGSYQLTEATNPEWVCYITITPK